MPMMPPKPCTKPGCHKMATKKGRCDDHQIKAWDHNGKSRHERGYGSVWVKIRRQALERDQHKCVLCLSEGVHTPATEVDHIIPKAIGGDDSLSNLQSICKAHHKEKTAAESSTGRHRVI